MGMSIDAKHTWQVDWHPYMIVYFNPWDSYRVELKAVKNFTIITSHI